MVQCMALISSMFSILCVLPLIILMKTCADFRSVTDGCEGEGHQIKVCTIKVGIFIFHMKNMHT